MTALWLAVLIASADARRPSRESPPDPPTRPDVTATHAALGPSAGSLWSDVGGRRMLGLDGTARQAGDLVTVRIVERTSTNLDATTTSTRESENEAAIEALLGAETRIIAGNPGMNGAIRMGGSSSSSFAGAGSTSREATLDSMITTEVIEVLPTGNLRLWGYKQVRVNREVQYVVLEGVVRPRDIQLGNVVTSDRLAESRIEVTGGGVVADKQGPGLLVRVLDALWPF
jgi:flagellar L-ring protein precursor FlgH